MLVLDRRLSTATTALRPAPGTPLSRLPPDPSPSPFSAAKARNALPSTEESRPAMGRPCSAQSGSSRGQQGEAIVMLARYVKVWAAVCLFAVGVCSQAVGQGQEVSSGQ